MGTVHKTKFLIVGSGPAGYTAAIYAARACLNPILVTGNEKGGQLMITTDVENYPGFAKAVQGPDLIEQMESQASNCGADIIFDHINEVDFSVRPFKLKGSNGDDYIADTVVISTGAVAKWLGLESETKYNGYGVSGCAVCDGFFYKGKDVVVVGGGNTAVEEALYLSKLVKKVYLIHRRDSLRAEKILQERLLKTNNIEPIWDSALEEVLGSEDPKDGGVSGVLIKNVKTKDIKTINVSGVFIAIGHSPNTELFKDYITLKDNGYIVTSPDSTETNIPGVYAAGDVQDDKYRQAVTAAATGCMAALEAEKFIADNELV